MYFKAIINLKIYFMLKSVLKITGIQTLNKAEKQIINGGHDMDDICRAFCRDSLPQNFETTCDCNYYS
tara:strand:- start:227 stop:430 length:204 start_codon:yes stop_codon:yes gene_type:complete